MLSIPEKTHVCGYTDNLRKKHNDEKMNGPWKELEDGEISDEMLDDDIDRVLNTVRGVLGEKKEVIVLFAGSGGARTELHLLCHLSMIYTIKQVVFFDSSYKDIKTSTKLHKMLASDKCHGIFKEFRIYYSYGSFIPMTVTDKTATQMCNINIIIGVHFGGGSFIFSGSDGDASSNATRHLLNDQQYINNINNLILQYNIPIISILHGVPNLNIQHYIVLPYNHVQNELITYIKNSESEALKKIYNEYCADKYAFVHNMTNSRNIYIFKHVDKNVNNYCFILINDTKSELDFAKCIMDNITVSKNKYIIAFADKIKEQDGNIIYRKMW